MTKNLISLKVKCPHCHKSLMDYTHFLHDKPSIKLHIEIKDHHGVINLASCYGCYDKVCNIELVDNEIARLSCPFCKKELPSPTKCEDCGAPLVGFVLEKGGIVHICSRVGCKKHYVTFEDIYDTLTQFYNEYDYGAHDSDF